MFMDAARVAPEKAALRPALPMFLWPGWIGTNMGKLSYGEQLKHPNWQRKRLEVLERADFKCECCFDSEQTLHVHHKRYVKGRMAWEYEAKELLALCESCHASTHENEEDFKAVLASLAPDGPNNINDAMALVAGWTRGHGDVIEATRLARSAPSPAIAGIIARELCELIGWTKGGLNFLIAFSGALSSDGFIEAILKTTAEFAEKEKEASEAEGPAGNA